MSITPRTDAEVYSPLKPVEDEWVPDFEFVPAKLCREMEGELRQIGQALREANAMIRHFDNTLYPGWTNLSREDIRRGMELVEKNAASESSPAS